MRIFLPPPNPADEDGLADFRQAELEAGEEGIEELGGAFAHDVGRGVEAGGVFMFLRFLERSAGQITIGGRKLAERVPKPVIHTDDKVGACFFQSREQFRRVGVFELDKRWVSEKCRD